MLKVLKRESLKQLGKSTGFKIGVLAIILFVFGSSFIKAIKGPVEFNSLS